MNSLMKMSLRDWIWIVIVVAGIIGSNAVMMYRVNAHEEMIGDNKSGVESSETSISDLKDLIEDQAQSDIRQEMMLEGIKEKVDLVYDTFTAELFKIWTNGDHAEGGEPE